MSQSSMINNGTVVSSHYHLVSLSKDSGIVEVLDAKN